MTRHLKQSNWCLSVLGAFVALSASNSWLGIALVEAATPAEVFQIWPDGKAPGQARVDPTKSEGLVTDRRRPFSQITNVSVPTVSVFLPTEKTRTGAAVLVCPGGGLQRLAYEHEGLEIADWLNPLGISVFVLKYRVPAPSATALLDAQRAMGLIRQRSTEFKIDSDRIAVMGFSAGAEVALLLAVNASGRNYELIDTADKLSCRPTNVCLLYAGGIARNGELRQDIKEKLDTKSTPSMFVVHAFGDASDNSLALASELKRARIPSEIHIYQEGGHGFGARDSGLPLGGWKASYNLWISAQGFLDKPYLIEYADELAKSLASKSPLRRLSADYMDLSLLDGYAVQRRLFAKQTAHDQIAGYSSAALDGKYQRTPGHDKPVTGVLFRSGRIDLSDKLVVPIGDEPASIATRIGFIVSAGADISTHIHKIEHVKGAFEAVVPIVELPIDLSARMSGELTTVDCVAANLGSSRFLVGKTGVNPDDLNLAEIKIKLQRDGTTLQQVPSTTALDDRWSDLIAIVNQIVDQGHTLHQGDLVICGETTPHVAQPGHYRADFGALGIFDFELK